MRVDKFLKLYKIIKRRTLANQACNEGFVLVNGKVAKPGKELSINDEVVVKFPMAGYELQIKILKLPNGNVVHDDDILIKKIELN